MNSRTALLCAALVAVAVTGVSGRATTTICDSGCTYTVSMANLNTAITAASPGDTILLQAGATFTGTMILRHKTGSSDITIKTGVEDDGDVLDASVWPAATTRICPPSYTDNTIESGCVTNYTGSLAKIIASGSNEPAVRTVLPAETGSGCAGAPCIANYYRLELLDISCPVSPDAPDVCVALGSQATSGSVPSGDTQNTAAEQPYNITLSQVYVHGTDTEGCLHGVMNAARDTTIQHSYIGNCWYDGSDAQAVWDINNTGGLTIVNTYGEASGEVFMSGGDDPRMNFTSTGITLTASSATTATLNTPLPDYMRVDDCVSVLVSAVKVAACISAIDGPRTGITFSPALSGAPDVPGSMKGGVVQRDLTFTGNWFNTPLAWRGVKGTRKNSFELKLGRNVTVTGNVFTNTWEHGQNGYAIVFTPVNQTPDSFNDSTQIANVLFSYNRVQNAVGCVNMSGIDANNVFSQRTEDITFSHVACENLSQTTYGDGVDDFFPAMGVGTGRVPLRAMPKNLTFNHVLIDSRANNVVFSHSSDASTAPQLAAMLRATNYTLTNSIIRNPTSGPSLLWYYSDDAGGYNSGTDSWDVVVGNGAGTCSNNALAGESSGAWTFCSSSTFPSNATLEANLVNYGTDYSVDQGGTYDNASTTGTDLGPNWTELLRLTDAARAGTAASSASYRLRLRIR
jgi:hypothetical protein